MLLHNSLPSRAKRFHIGFFSRENSTKNFRTLRHWASARLISYPTAGVIILELSVFCCWQHAKASFSLTKRLSAHFITKASDLHFGDFRNFTFLAPTPIIRWEYSTKLRENPLCDCFTDESSKRNEQRSEKFFFSSSSALFESCAFVRKLPKSSAQSTERKRKLRCSRGFIKNSFLWKWKFPFVSNFFTFVSGQRLCKKKTRAFITIYTLACVFRLTAGRVWVRMFCETSSRKQIRRLWLSVLRFASENLVKIEKNPNKPLDVRGWNQLSRPSRLFGAPEITFCGLDERIVRQMISFLDGIP